jgi:hypothetical protein
MNNDNRWDSPEAYYTHMIGCKGPMDDITPEQERFFRYRLQQERTWYRSRRPYYLVYPAIADALIRTNYEGIDLSSLDIPHQPVEIRLAEPIDEHHAALGRIYHVGDNAIPYYFFVDPRNDTNLPNDLSFWGGHGNIMDSQWNQLIIGIALLSQDTDWLVPEPLKKDLAKYEESGDERLIDRAHRRGKRCWSIGRQIETAAHLRRPHFAVRWMRPENAKQYIGEKATGKELMPILRPIKGSVVQRDRIKKIPTDYIDRQEDN